MRLIDADALLKHYSFVNGQRILERDIDNFPITVDIREIKKAIREAPTVEAEPIKHGGWKFEDGWFSCSQCCDYVDYDNAFLDFKYCPHCGAKMDKED